MTNIQVGLDLATSASVIGAAVYFVYNTAKEGYKNRKYSLRKQRIEQMSLLISNFSKILRMGDDIVQNCRKMQSGNMEFDAKKLITRDFVYPWIAI